MLLRCFFLLALFLNITLCLSGQKIVTSKTEPRVDTYNHLKNFSFFITDILKDEKGYLWYSYFGGVFRYDGNNFKTFNPTSFPNATVLKMYQDYANRIWFVSYTGHLSYHENGEIVHYPYNDKIKHLIARNKCNSLYVDSLDNVHLGISGRGYWKVEKDGTLTQIIGPSNNLKGMIVFHMPDQSPFLCAMSNRGGDTSFINFLDDSLKLIKQSCFADDQKRYIPHPDNYLLKRKNGDLHIAKGNLLFCFKKDGSISRQYFDAPLVNLLEDSKGGIWAGVYNKGVRFFPSGELGVENMSEYLIDEGVAPEAEDINGNIWLKSLKRGVHQIVNPNFPRFPHDDLKFPIESGSEILWANNQILIGNSNGSLFTIKDQALYGLTDSLPLDPSTSGVIVSLHFDSVKKELWLGFKGKVLYQQKKEWKEVTIDGKSVSTDVVRSFWQNLNNNDVWVAIGKQLACIRNYNYSFVSESLPTNILEITGDGKGKLWLACLDGLWLFEDNKFTHLGDFYPELKNMANNIFFHDNSLFIGFIEQGLYRLYQDSLRPIKFDDGENIMITSYTHDDESIWSISPRGLHQIKSMEEDGGRLSVKTYDLDAKLTYASFGMVKVDQQFFAASPEGLYSFSLNQLTKNKGVPTSLIEEVKINRKDTSIQPSYELDYNFNHIQIKYTGLEFDPNRELIYSYRMDGVDNEWIETYETNIQYVTLPPGLYTFYVKSKTAFGSWSESVSIQFNISPPWWETWWARTGGALMIILIIYGVFLTRFRIKKKQIGLELQFMQAERKALRAQLNPHFFFNALNSVQYYILRNESDASMSFLSKFTKLMRQVLDNSGETSIPLEQEIEVLSNYADLETVRFNGRISYAIEVDKKVDLKKVAIPTMIIQPHVENAIQHGLANLNGPGRLVIQFNLKGDQLECVIEDNGIGREAANKVKKGQHHQSVGTKLTKNRIQLINTLFDQKLSESVEDILDDGGNIAGTRVILLFPINVT